MKSLSKFKTALAVSMLLSGSAFSMERNSACAALEEALNFVSPKKAFVAENRIIVQGGQDVFNPLSERDTVFKELKTRVPNAVWFDSVNNPETSVELAGLAARIYEERESDHHRNAFRAAFERDRGHCGSHGGQFRDDSALFTALGYAAFRLENRQESDELDKLKSAQNVAEFAKMICLENIRLLDGRKEAAGRKMKDLELSTLDALNRDANFRDFDQAIGFKPCAEKTSGKVTETVTVHNKYDQTYFNAIRENLPKFDDPSLDSAKKELQAYELTNARIVMLEGDNKVALERLNYNEGVLVQAAMKVQEKVVAISEKRLDTKQARERQYKQPLLSSRILDLQIESANILDKGCYAPYRKNTAVRKQMADKHMNDVKSLLSIIAKNGHQVLLEKEIKSKQSADKEVVKQAEAALSVARFINSSAYRKSSVKQEYKVVEATLCAQVSDMEKRLAKMGKDEVSAATKEVASEKQVAVEVALDVNSKIKAEATVNDASLGLVGLLKNAFTKK